MYVIKYFLYMSAAVTPYDDIDVNPDPDSNPDSPVSEIDYYCYVTKIYIATYCIQINPESKVL